MQNFTRRSFIKTISTGSAVVVAAMYSARASAADFTLKYGSYQPASYPLTIRSQEMAARIKEQSKGRIDFQVYPSGQLGNDTNMLSQLREGSIDFMTLSALTLGVLVPAAQISGIGFAFKDYNTVWKAMDGDLGEYVRRKIETTSLFAFEKMWDNGFREMTTSTHQLLTPADLSNLKMRVPPSPLWTSMFRAFGAAPTTISLGDVYTSLQTHIVEGQENPLALIEAVKIYEVQKYCAMTNHMWDGFWCLGNKKRFARLPKDLQEIVQRNVNDAAIKQRNDVAVLNGTLTDTLKARGLQFNNVDEGAFRAKLQTSGFYKEWKNKFGDELWTELEKYSGKIA